MRWYIAPASLWCYEIEWEQLKKVVPVHIISTSTTCCETAAKSQRATQSELLPQLARTSRGRHRPWHDSPVFTSPWIGGNETVTDAVPFPLPPISTLLASSESLNDGTCSGEPQQRGSATTADGANNDDEECPTGSQRALIMGPRDEEQRQR